VAQRKHQEWIILQIVRPDARVAGGGFFAMKGSVLDRLRADFNLDKRDRYVRYRNSALSVSYLFISCVQLAWATGQENPAAWAEFINKIKEGLHLALESSVLQREEEVKRSESQRQMPGWNFCTFFILKVRKLGL
jgi:trafficking protein particle complex subunit 10